MDRTEIGMALSGQLEPLSELIVSKLIARLMPEAKPAPEPVPYSDSNPKGATMALEDAAARLQHSYFWLSRNYRKLGLRPSRIGCKLVFRESEINALVSEKKVRFRGRPKIG